MNYTINHVTDENELDRVLAFAQRIFGKNEPGLEVQSRNKWLRRIAVHPELMLFAEANNEVIAIVLSFLESNGNITIGPVATDAGLLSLNPDYPIAFTNIYDGTVNQVCLKLPQADRALQKLYETTFDDCYTQAMF